MQRIYTVHVTPAEDTNLQESECAEKVYGGRILNHRVGPNFTRRKGRQM